MSRLVEIFRQDVKNEVTCATFSDDLEILILGFEDGLVSIYNALKKKQVADLEPAHSACITALAISPDSKWISVGRSTGSLANFLTRTAYLEQVVIGHRNLLHSVQFSADSKLLVSASACGIFMVHSLQDDRPLFRLSFGRPCLSCSISFDSRVIAVGLSDGSVHAQMWRPDDAECRSGHLDLCRQLSRRLKSRAAFQVDADAASLIYRGHRCPVTALAFARESRLLATGGSHDRLVTVANWDTLQEVAVLTGHESWVTLLRWGRGDRCLLSSAEHDSVKLWNRGDSCGFLPRPEATVSLETMCCALHCRVESPGSFAVAGCADNPTSAAAADARELQLDELLDVQPAEAQSETEAMDDG